MFFFLSFCLSVPSGPGFKPLIVWFTVECSTNYAINAIPRIVVLSFEKYFYAPMSRIGAMTFSLATFSLMTLGRTIKSVTISISKLYTMMHKAICIFYETCILLFLEWSSQKCFFSLSFCLSVPCGSGFKPLIIWFTVECSTNCAINAISRIVVLSFEKYFYAPMSRIGAMTFSLATLSLMTLGRTIKLWQSA